MRIASYNIMSGGFKGYTFEDKSPPRLDLIREAIGNINADLVGFIDTFRWKEIFTIDELKNILGYKEIFCIDMEDKRVGESIGLTVATNYSNVQFSKVWLETRYCIRVEIKLSNPLVIYVVYLDDVSEELRLKQIEAVFKDYDPNKRTIIMGDFNAIYPKDGGKLKADIETFINQGVIPEKDQKYFRNYAQGVSESKVIPYILSKGFHDAINELKREPTFATELFSMNLGRFICVDHIFCSKNLKNEKFQTLRGEIFEKTSDHYPVTIEVE